MNCKVMRRKLVTHSTLNIASGDTTPGRQEWVTEPCNAPLFGDQERADGKCRSCKGGWTHPNNFPVEGTDNG